MKFITSLCAHKEIVQIENISDNWLQITKVTMKTSNKFKSTD